MTTENPHPTGGPPSDAGSATITVDSVSLSFADHEVLEDVSLSVESGEFVGLVGPNGAGKTTLLRAISGALEPDSGRVSIDGTDVHDVGSRTSSRLVSVVPQDTSLSFSFPVRDVVAMGRHPHRSRFSAPSEEDRDAVERALERTRTAELAERPIDEVSGGQRQRVVLARAIAQDTPALLLDEPTASLDVNHQIETFEFVRELVADGRAVVAAIHDLTLAARYCDRLALLADGGVHSVGPPADVLTTDALASTFDATATVTTNPVTGTETVTALPDTSLNAETVASTTSSRRSGTSSPRIHVLGSGTAAAGVLARLETASVEALDISVGPIPRGDATVEVADQFDSGSLVVEPFASLSPAAENRIERWLEAADVVVLAGPTGGSGVTNALLESVEASDSLTPEETVVVADGPPLADRAVGDGGTEWVYEQCREHGYEATLDTVLEAVAASLDAQAESGTLE